MQFFKKEFRKIRFAFFTKKDENTISFILMSGWMNTYYTIDFKEFEGLVEANKENYLI